jgi:hypothetical protein
MKTQNLMLHRNSSQPESARKHAGFFDLGLSLALMAIFGATAVTIEHAQPEMAEATKSAHVAVGASDRIVASSE